MNVPTLMVPLFTVTLPVNVLFPSSPWKPAPLCTMLMLPLITPVNVPVPLVNVKVDTVGWELMTSSLPKFAVPPSERRVID